MTDTADMPAHDDPVHLHNRINKLTSDLAMARQALRMILADPEDGVQPRTFRSRSFDRWRWEDWERIAWPDGRT